MEPIEPNKNILLNSAVSPLSNKLDQERSRPEQFLSLIRQQQRGRLKIYLGFAPGVGKTYEMLQEAQRLKRQGVDVVIGIVEPHGRPETVALQAGLETIPPRRIEYHGIQLEELALEQIIQRKPMVVIVDELAHTNAPGSKNTKRYQDVETILRHGIHVISTMNIQHLESLYDIIEHFTNIKVKERVPDYILAEADQIVNVDLSAEDLQDRLRQGKVYPLERVEKALTNFFTGENLSRLRELALEEIASILDRKRSKNHDNLANGSERIMVCLSSRSPNIHRLLRRAARLADRFNAPWYAIYVQTPKERTEKIDAATQRQIAESLTLAQQLGGIPMQFIGQTFAQAVVTFVKEYAITHLLMGRSLRPWYQRWCGQSALDRLLAAEIAHVDITLIDIR